MKSYPCYVSTKILDVDQVPETWSERRFRYIFDTMKGLTITKESLQDEGIPCINYGEVHSKYGFEVDTRRDELRCVSKDYITTNKKSLLKKGDLIFADTSEDIEGSGNFTQLINDAQAFAGYHTIIARPKDGYHPRFLAYFIESTAFRSQVQRAIKGIKVFSITNAILKNSLLLIPTPNEQQTIAAYLDRQTQHIDNLIAEKQNFINLLEEKRKALVESAAYSSETVGMRWKWCTVPVFRSIDRKDDQYYQAVGLFNRGRGIFKKEIKLGSELGDSVFHTIKSGDLILSGQFAWEGSVSMVVDEFNDLICSHRYHVYKGKEGVAITEYLWAYLTTQDGDFLLNQCSRGSAGRNRPLSANLLANYKIPIPHIDVQHKIADFVRRERLLREEAEVFKDLLMERKAALINAAVTGKIDVREAV